MDTFKTENSRHVHYPTKLSKEETSHQSQLTSNDQLTFSAPTYREGRCLSSISNYRDNIPEVNACKIHSLLWFIRYLRGIQFIFWQEPNYFPKLYFHE